MYKCTTQEKVKKDIYAVTLVTLGSENGGREIFLYMSSLTVLTVRPEHTLLM